MGLKRSKPTIPIVKQPGVPTFAHEWANTISAKNTTGAAINWAGPAAITGLLFTEGGQYKGRPVLTLGTVPDDASHQGGIAIATAKIPINTIGQVVVAGICYANVNRTNVAHRFVKCSGGILVSASAGGIGRILWHNGTGLALILLGTYGDFVTGVRDNVTALQYRPMDRAWTDFVTIEECAE